MVPSAEYHYYFRNKLRAMAQRRNNITCNPIHTNKNYHSLTDVFLVNQGSIEIRNDDINFKNKAEALLFGHQGYGAYFGESCIF